MKDAKIKCSPVHAVVSAMILRRVVGEPDDTHVQRMRAIYDSMKHHHWFLTGPDDLAECAMLVAREGTPEEIGDHIEAIYRRLGGERRIWRGEAATSAPSSQARSAITSAVPSCQGTSRSVSRSGRITKSP